ncbi:MAG: DHH family phosphoesterase [Halobacteriales archaeon]
MSDPLDLDGLPIARKSVLPGHGFFRTKRHGAEVSDALGDAAVVAVADPDADGLTAAAIVRAHHGEATIVPTEPHEFDATLERLAEVLESPEAVYVLDLCPDGPAVAEVVERLVAGAGRVRWFDHHRWDPETRAAVEGAGVELTVGDSDEVATADVTLEAMGDGLDDRWRDLVAAVRDHDLWIREDPRSDDLADFAHWSDPEQFVEVVAEHGADLTEAVHDELEARRVEKQELIEVALERAEYREIGGITVGLTYGRCSQNEVAEGMRRRGADAAAVIKPAGGVSLRGTDAFRRCHEVAERLGGGGHPEAAGCKPPVFDDLLDYVHHWTTHGASARHAILGAFRAVLEDGEG